MKKPVKAALLLVVSASFLASCNNSQPEDTLTDDSPESSSSSSSASSSASSSESSKDTSTAQTTPESSAEEASTEEGKYYTVSFNSNGGSEVASQRVKEGEKATKPADPTKEGSTFGGWFITQSLTTEFDFANTAITTDYELFAKWNVPAQKAQYWIANSVTGWEKDTAVQMDLPSEGDDLAVLKNYTVTAGFEFKITDFAANNEKWIGYDSDQDGLVLSGGGDSPNVIIKRAGTYDFALTSDFKIKVSKVSSSEEDNKKADYWLAGDGRWTIGTGAFEMLKDTANENKAVLYGVSLEKDKGYKVTNFGSEWYGYNDSLSGVASANSDNNIVIAESGKYNVYLNGSSQVWIEWVSHTVSFDSKGGSDVADASIADGKNAAKPEDPTKEGFDFAGWYADENLTSEFAFESTPITADLTLYAKWTEKKVTVTFDTDGAGSIDPLELTYGQSASKPSDPVKTGYNFQYWYEGSDDTASFDFSSAIRNDITLHAKWDVIVNEVTFKYCDSSTADLVKRVNYGDKVEKPSKPTRAGYAFKGWYTAETEGTEFDFEESEIVAGITLYGRWEEIRTHTVSFDTNEGTSVAAQEVPEGETATLPENPTKVGYVFDGWYVSEAEDAQVFDFNSAITSDVTVYAKWSDAYFNVVFHTNCEVAAETKRVKYNGNVDDPSSSLSKTGYTFVGWYTDEACSDSCSFAIASAPITQSIDLYAKWDRNTYTITFHSVGGSDVDSMQAKYGDTIESPVAPTKSGWAFAGWYTAETEGAEFNFEEDIITESIDLYAHWATPRTVSFNYGDELGNNTEVADGKTVKEPEEPTREGYVFKYWYIEGDDGKAYSFDTPVTSDITLVAKWAELSKYYLTGSFSSWGKNADYRMEVPSSGDDLAVLTNFVVDAGFTFKISDCEPNSSEWYGYRDALSNVASGETGGNITITEMGYYNFYLNKDKQVWVEKATDDTKASYWLVGSFCGWKATEGAIQMDKDSSDDLAVLKGYHLEKGATLKIVDGKYQNWYGYRSDLSAVASGTDGSDITITETGDYDIYLNSSSQVWIVLSEQGANS